MIIDVGSHGTTTFTTSPSCSYYYLYSHSSSSKAEYTIYSYGKLTSFGFLFSQYQYNEVNMPDSYFVPVTEMYESVDGSQYIYSVTIYSPYQDSTSEIYLYFSNSISNNRIIVEVSAGISVIVILLIIIGGLILIYIGAVIIAVCLGKTVTEGLCICLICLGCLACLSRH